MLYKKAYQENALDIGLDTLPSLVSISQVRECITKTLQKPPSSGDALTRVSVYQVMFVNGPPRLSFCIHGLEGILLLNLHGQLYI